MQSVVNLCNTISLDTKTTIWHIDLDTKYQKSLIISSSIRMSNMITKYW